MSRHTLSKNSTTYSWFEKNTGFLLQLAHRRSRKAFNQALRPLAIEARHLGALSLIKEGPLTQRELIYRLELDKSSVVYIVDDLERMGLAQRKSAAHDRRANAVHITKSGSRRLAEAVQIATKLNNQLFDCLNSRETEVLHDLLRRLIDHMSP